jgi:hypothetical protein
LAVAEHDLGAVETDSFDPEADLALGWFGKREFVELEDFGATNFVAADDLYCGGHAYSRGNFCSSRLDEEAVRKTQNSN